jgi:hypothetical protein
MLRHIKAYYGCYETIKNGGFHIHTLLYHFDSPNPNTLIQTLRDDEYLWEHTINYLNDIITRDINMYKSSNSITQNENDKCDDYIHPCTARPLDTNENTFHELFDNDVCKWMNVCNDHECNPTCYKSYIDTSKKLCKYSFPQPLINATHFDNDVGLLHIKRIDKCLNNFSLYIICI